MNIRQPKTTPTNTAAPTDQSVVTAVVSKKHLSKRRRLLLVGLGLVALITGVLGLGAAGVYWLQWQNWYTYDIGRILSLPVASIDGQKISYKNYYVMADFEYWYLTSTSNSKSLSSSKLHQAADHQAINVLTQLAFLDNYARQHHINVSDRAVLSGVAADISKASASLRAKYKADQQAVAEQVRLGLLKQSISRSLKPSSSQVKQALARAKTMYKQFGNQGLINLYSKNVVTSLPPDAPTNLPAKLPADVAHVLSSLPLNILSNPIVSSDGNIYLVERVGTSNSKPKPYIMVVQPGSGINFDGWLSAQLKSHPAKIYLQQLSVTAKNG